jgi:hypothetical protein
MLGLSILAHTTSSATILWLLSVVLFDVILLR